MWILSKTAFGWIITCIVVGITTGLLCSQGAYGPTVPSLIQCKNNSLIYNIN